MDNNIAMDTRKCFSSSITSFAFSPTVREQLITTRDFSATIFCVKNHRREAALHYTTLRRRSSSFPDVREIGYQTNIKFGRDALPVASCKIFLLSFISAITITVGAEHVELSDARYPLPDFLRPAQQIMRPYKIIARRAEEIAGIVNSEGQYKIEKATPGDVIFLGKRLACVEANFSL